MTIPGLLGTMPAASNGAQPTDDGVAGTVTGTALVAAYRPATRSVSPVTRPDAPFVTQLIATAMQMPQTRSLRRLEACDARGAYLSGPSNADRSGRGRIVAQSA